MTLTLDLPQDVQQRLEDEARRLGVPVDQYAMSLLGGGGTPSSRPADGRELVEYWRQHQVIGSRPDIEDPTAHARRIRRQAERRVSS